MLPSSSCRNGGAHRPSVPRPSDLRLSPQSTEWRGREVGWGNQLCVAIKLSLLSPSNGLLAPWFWAAWSCWSMCMAPSLTHSLTLPLCPIYGNEPSALSVTAAQIEERLRVGGWIWQTKTLILLCLPLHAADAFRCGQNFQWQPGRKPLDPMSGEMNWRDRNSEGAGSSESGEDDTCSRLREWQGKWRGSSPLPPAGHNIKWFNTQGAFVHHHQREPPTPITSAPTHPVHKHNSDSRA